jgi:hypothetical protein
LCGIVLLIAGNCWVSGGLVIVVVVVHWFVRGHSVGRLWVGCRWVSRCRITVSWVIVSWVSGWVGGWVGGWVSRS